VYSNLRIGTERLWLLIYGQSSFFLDEATALAAGHRPCFECRRADANRFKAAWIKGNPDYGFDMKTPIGKIDDVLQSQRITANGKKATFKTLIDELPDGTFIEIDSEPYLLSDAQLWKWSPEGYEIFENKPLNRLVNVLTPFSIVNAIKAGYCSLQQAEEGS
jgi:hypothetical protein